MTEQPVPLPTHPTTGLTAVGVVGGRPLWPILGAAPEPGEQQEQGQTDDQGKGQQTEQEQQQETPAREAARYRTQLRAAEAERDGLAASLRTVRQQLVEGVVELAKPDALWTAGVNVDELFDDDGHMDRDKVKAAVAEQVERLGLAKARRLPRADPSQGRGMTDVDSGEGWGGAIRASRGR